MPSWIDTKVTVIGTSNNHQDIRERFFTDHTGSVTDRVFLSNFSQGDAKCDEPNETHTLSSASWILVQTVGAISDVQALDFKFSSTAEDRYELSFRTCTVGAPPITGLRAMAHILSTLTSTISMELMFQDDFDDRWSGAWLITSDDDVPEFSVDGHETRIRLLCDEGGNAYACEPQYCETFRGSWLKAAGYQSQINWVR